MPESVKTMKLHIHVGPEDHRLLCELTERFSDACTGISRYVFDHGFILNFMTLQNALYQDVRSLYGLKSQFTISAFKTVTARYKAVQTQLSEKPYKYRDSDGTWKYIPRTLEWLRKPVVFRRPQADFVRGRDYSFVTDRHSGKPCLSLNTLAGRVRATYDVPENFREYFSGEWSFGTGKLVSLKGEWYFHIPMTRKIPDVFEAEKPSHVVGIDRGLRFIATVYDETGKTSFISGKDIMARRDSFQNVRSELQSRGTRSAKRALKRISGRENRWMSDVNHRISKTLVREYGPGTLFVIEDLKGVSFEESSLRGMSASQRNGLCSWAFYQLEQFLAYKAEDAGSGVIKVAADYTSQRCPKCGRIHKENRHHETHEYICDACGYRSNDDRTAAMNIQLLGTMHVSGDANPRFGTRKTG